MAIGRSTPQMHHGIYIMGFIWQPFWILQEKVGISFYFWVIRVVNSQLALYSHVRCNPLDTPNTPETPQKHPYMTITNVNYEGSYLPGVICNIVVIADLGRYLEDLTPQCWHLVVKTGNWQIYQQIYPPKLTSSGQDWQLTDLPADLPLPHQHWHLMVQNGNSLCYWHLVVKNRNFTLLLTSSGQERRFHIATDI